MHRFALLCCFLALASETAGQVPLSAPAPHGRSYFGAPVAKYTLLRDQGALMFGGRGGYNITPSLVIGAGAQAQC
jgi:hypothetical protein